MASPSTIALREQQEEMRAKSGKLVRMAPTSGSRQVLRQEQKENRGFSHKKVVFNRKSG